MEEKMLPIEGYEGLYSVTSLGRVWSCPRVDSFGRDQGGFFLSLRRLGKDRGHLCVALSKDGKYKYLQVHRLVALAFLPNPENRSTVNHIDGNQSNNDVSNLEWATHQENQDHAWRTGLCRKTKPKLTQEDADAIRAEREAGLSYQKIAKKYSVDPKCIWQIVAGKSYKGAGT